MKNNKNLTEVNMVWLFFPKYLFYKILYCPFKPVFMLLNHNNG